MNWRSYVAVGDSFTEGLDDPYPDGTQFRGWANLLAARLSRDTPDFRYANLAIRGKVLDDVVDAQLPVALRLRPDLVSFAAGGNDALRRGFAGARLAERLEHVVKLIHDSGADVMIFKFADVTGRLPGRRLILPRMTLLNGMAGDLAAKYGAKLVDLWTDDEFRNPALWSVDRLHMNAYGHRRVAAHAATALGVEPDPAWWESPPPVPVVRWATRRAADARWARTHLAPWVRRRLTGQSSGDHRTAKRPDLTRLTEY
jgi:lysophospholipase L1-like esterase